MAATISSVALEAEDVQATEAFYAAVGLADRVSVRPAEAPTEGFHGFTLSLVAAGPSVVDAYLDTAAGAGARVVKPASRSFWGYGGSFEAPDGTVWTVASSAKKDSGATTMAYDDLVLLLGVEDVKGAKQRYVEQGLEVARGFGSKYVEFAAPDDGVKLALQSRRAVAKNAGVDAHGEGSHRMTIIGDLGEFTDPDGFAWEQVRV